MKTKLLVSTLLTLSFLLSPFSFFLAEAQVPDGFNYQAVATYSGSPVTTAITVRITIQELETGGETFWIEDHTGVVPNSQGLFNIVIGNGIKVTGSTANTFADIDWSESPKYLKTDIDYSGWKPMGVSKLQSVPYSLVAKNIVSPVDKIGIKGVTSNMEEALFEVKNKNGQIVFAVYNEGVRIYVDDGSKGSKGGFAIGGFDVEEKGLVPGPELLVVDPKKIRMYIDKDLAGKSPKGGFAIGGFGYDKGDTTQTYMRITNDTTKFFINDDPASKGPKGGFAIGGFSEAKGFKNYFNVESPLATPVLINPSENRILFHPLKNAFLVGKVLITDINNVGENSFVSGYESIAKGNFSQALGYKAKAGGEGSTAIGNDAYAQGKYSFAFGDSAFVLADDAYAIGAGALATGRGSFAIGSKDKLFGDNFEKSTSATGLLSMAIGLDADAVGSQSFASGISVKATGIGSIAFGRSATASGDFSMALQGTASGMGSISIGGGSATAFNSIIIGLGTSSGWGSTVIGNGDATNEYSMALGYNSTASGKYSIAAGMEATAQASGSFVIGSYNIISGNIDSYVNTDPVFVIGNGTYITPSNALTVLRNGKTAIGHDAPTQMLDVNGQVRIRGGNPTAGKVLTTSADGTATWENIVIGSHSHSTADLTSGTMSVSRGGTGDPDLTVNKVLVGNGTSAILQPANLHWDNTNSSLGIGTTSPGTYKLSVTSSLGGLTSATGNFENTNTTNGIALKATTNSSDGTALFIQQGSGYSLRCDGYDPSWFVAMIIEGRNVGINTGSPTQNLDVNGNGRFRSIGSGAYAGVLNRTSDGTLTVATSDIRFKDEINTITNSLNSVMNLRGVSFLWKSEPEMGKRIGFIAQEVEQVIPELVFTNPVDGYKGVNYAEMTALLVEAVKEQQSQIEALKSELQQIKALLQNQE